MYFLLFRNYLPLEKGEDLYLNKLESPSPKDALCQVWLKLAQWFWRRRWKCEKFTDGQTDRWTDRQTTDDRWSEKLTWAFSSGELTLKMTPNPRKMTGNVKISIRKAHLKIIGDIIREKISYISKSVLVWSLKVCR